MQEAKGFGNNKKIRFRNVIDISIEFRREFISAVCYNSMNNPERQFFCNAAILCLKDWDIGFEP